MTLAPFHLAFPVNDLAEARAFYGALLGCSEGRSDADWVDFNFFGHQIVAYRAPHATGSAATSGVDGDLVNLAWEYAHDEAVSKYALERDLGGRWSAP